MLLRLNTVLLRTLIRPTTTIMEVIVSSTMVMEMATTSLMVVVVVIMAMVMAVGGCGGQFSLTFSTVIISMKITMSLLN